MPSVHTIRYTTHGYRVIALSVRHLAPSFNLLKVQRMEATDAEKDVDFLGFVVLENRLKPESAPVIKELQVRRDEYGIGASFVQLCNQLNHVEIEILHES